MVGQYFLTPSIRPGNHSRQAAGLVCLFGELVNKKRCGIPTGHVDVSADADQIPSSPSSALPVTFFMSPCREGISMATIRSDCAFKIIEPSD